MTDADFEASWRDLEPSSPARQRIRLGLFAQLEAHDTPLALEWLRALRLAPLATLGLTALSALAIGAGPAALLASVLG